MQRFKDEPNLCASLRIARHLIDDRGCLRIVNQEDCRGVAERGRDVVETRDREGGGAPIHSCRALALATSVRPIAPCVRALAAIAALYQMTEAMLSMIGTGKRRSASADVCGETLTAIVSRMASPKFGQDTTGGSGADDP
jgi:hypothetical protein